MRQISHLRLHYVNRYYVTTTHFAAQLIASIYNAIEQEELLDSNNKKAAEVKLRMMMKLKKLLSLAH